MEEDGSEEHAVDGNDSTEVQGGDAAAIVSDSIEANAEHDEPVSKAPTVPDVQDEDYEVPSHAEIETVLPENMLSSDYGLETEGQIRQDPSPAEGSIEEPSTNGTPHTEIVKGKGSVQYVEHRLEDGNLAAVLEDITGFQQILRDDDPEPNTNGAGISSSQPTSRTTVADSPPSLLVMVSKYDLLPISNIHNS